MSRIPPIFSCFEQNSLPAIKVRGSQQPHKLTSEEAMHELFPKIHDKTILKALVELSKVEFESDDIAYINSLGAKLSFKSGKEVINYLSANGTKIKFDKTAVKGVFAQYNNKDNVIILSNKYSGSQDPAVIFAIAEAILHESGHTKDKDSYNSVQEEIDNLALNVLAHKYFLKNYPDAFKSSTSPIVKDGVNIYADMFYSEDPEKKALVERLKQKYGHLPPGDVVHPASVLGLKVKSF